MTEGTSNDTAVCRDMDQITLDAAYNNIAAVTDSARWLTAWSERSARSRRDLNSVLDIRYGNKERNTLDLFLSGAPSAPLFVFIHGGYWQNNDKSRFSFIADGLRTRGVDVAVPGYSLAPEIRLGDIIDEIQQALAFIRNNLEQFRQDHQRIIVGGWSAGGHLSAMVQAHADVAGVLPISGIFDLEPIAQSYINTKLQLTREEVLGLSPIYNWPEQSIPVRMAVGALELPELVRQSADYADAARRRDCDVEFVRMANRHHFSILEELSNPDGVLAQMVIRLCKDVPPKRNPH